jgi:adenylate kinase family enzyme
MQRVAVIGSGGAGKSTLSRQIGAIADLPVIHLDHHYWSPGWVATPDPEWAVIQRELLAADRWVVDGNYGGTLDLRAELADTIVFLDLPRRVCLSRALRRVRSPRLQAPGCPQRVDFAFLRWIWSFPYRTRPRLLAVLDTYAAAIEVVHLVSNADVRAYLDRLRRPVVRDRVGDLEGWRP